MCEDVCVGKFAKMPRRLPGEETGDDPSISVCEDGKPSSARGFLNLDMDVRLDRLQSGFLRLICVCEVWAEII